VATGEGVHSERVNVEVAVRRTNLKNSAKRKILNGFKEFGSTKRKKINR